MRICPFFFFTLARLDDQRPLPIGWHRVPRATAARLPKLFVVALMQRALHLGGHFQCVSKVRSKSIHCGYGTQKERTRKNGVAEGLKEENKKKQSHPIPLNPTLFFSSSIKRINGQTWAWNAFQAAVGWANLAPLLRHCHVRNRYESSGIRRPTKSIEALNCSSTFPWPVSNWLSLQLHTECEVVLPGFSAEYWKKTY